MKRVSTLVAIVSLASTVLFVIATATRHWSSVSVSSLGVTPNEQPLEIFSGFNMGLYSVCYSQTIIQGPNQGLLQHQCVVYSSSCNANFTLTNQSFGDCIKLKTAQTFCSLSTIFAAFASITYFLVLCRDHPISNRLPRLMSILTVVFGVISTSTYVKFFNEQVNAASTYFDYSFMIFTVSWGLHVLLMAIDHIHRKPKII